MIKKFLKVSLVTMLSVSMLMSTVVMAADNDSAIETTTENVDTNNGTIETNAEGITVTTNEGKITLNNGEVTTNNGQDNVNTEGFDAGIYKNAGTVGTNNGSISTNYGTVDTNANGGHIGSVYQTNGGSAALVKTNEAGGTIGYLNTTATCETNNGEIEVNWGLVKENNGTITDNTKNATQSGNIKGTVTLNNTNGVITENYANVTLNKGTVETNREEGVVTNDTNGVVNINWGGTVNGSGTIQKNMGAGTVADTVNILQQFWAITSEKLGHIDISGRNETPGYSDMVHTFDKEYLWESGSAIITPVDQSKEIKSITTNNNGATIVKLDDGTYKISGITKDVVLMVTFVGESVPVPVVVHPENKEEKEEEAKETKVENTAPVVNTTPAVATLTVGTPIPAAPSAIVERIAPVVSLGSTFAAVDLNGVPTNANVTRVENKVLETASVSVITQALVASNITVSEILPIYTGSIVTASTGSVMTMSSMVGSNEMKDGTKLYVVFKNPITGAMTYVLPKINKDGSISFEVPFNNCEFSIIKTK